MREECIEAGKYCGTKRHTKSLKLEYPDLSLVKYVGYISCGFCKRSLEWKIFNKQIIYRNRIRNEYIPKIEPGEDEVPPKTP